MSASENRIELGEEPPADISAQMREAFERVMETKPATMILIYEGAEKVGIRVLGAPRDLIPVFLAGGDLLEDMVKRSLHSANRNG